MDNPNPTDIPKISKLNEIIDDIKVQGDLSGVILAYKDGRLIVENTEGTYNFDEFIPLIASALRSAEDIGDCVSGRKVKKIIAQLEDISIMILKTKIKSAFLALIINEESCVGSVLENFDTLSKQIEENI
ncbi:MAG: hypothetical protein BAJALOKI3v1_90054 [Promethearchaeota archaeon]|nr:MAG: hypothetical protein BAJALOKI3v1_90054 [Candidatus Lokiarchaeota archaeon]